MVLNLPVTGDTLLLHKLFNTLNKGLNILKWVLLTLLFWLALAAMLFFIFPTNKSLFYISLAAWVTAYFFVYKKVKQKIGFVVSLLLVLLITWGAIHTIPVQNYLVKTVSEKLSKNLQTTIAVQQVNFSLFNKMLIQGVLVKDKNQDTLLYAGTAKVNITDWFFFKDKATLQYLALSNVVANLNRTDSVWNYQFLIDYFSSPKKNKPTKDGLQIDFKTVALENIRFNKIDKWLGNDLHFSFNKLNIDADSINIDKKIIALNTINIDKPVFAEINYTGNRPKQNNIATIIPTTAALKWNEDGWLLSIKDVVLSDGKFATEIKNVAAATDNTFDGNHIVFAAINGHFKNIQFKNDTLSGKVNLSTKERSGFTVKELQANVKFTPEIMEFNNLNLVTNKSKLGNYYAMKYDGFNKSFADFIHSVKLQGKFENTQVHSDDIAFFAPELKTWNRVVDIKGNASGSIDNLVAKNMLIKSGSTIVDGDIALKGLPDITTTFIDFKSNSLVTNYSDLSAFIPSLKNITEPNLSVLGNINFKGNFIGFINDFVTYGNINTGLGNVIADINMKLPNNSIATYSGKISSEGFNIGKFTATKELGNIALDGNVAGSGFSLKTIKAAFKGNIHQIDFNNYNYKNLVADGTLDKQLFTGHGSINDPNLKIDNFNGSISLITKQPFFNFDANLQKSDLKKLHLTDEDFALTGHFNLNFTGNNIDNFLGTAKVYEATLLHNNTRLSFDSLTLNSLIKDNKKYLSLQSNEVEGNVTGNFKILELPNAFKVFLNRYYPTYIPKPKHTVSNQDFAFYIKTKAVDEYIQLIDKKLKGFDDATFAGSLNLAKNELNFNADVPTFQYDKKIFNSVSLQSKGNLDSLQTKVTTGDIGLNDSLHFPGTNLFISSKNDISNIALKTSASKTLNEAELNATVQTLADGASIHFSPSSFIINDKKWQLEKDGQLTIRQAYIDASEVKFVQGNQEIVFSTEMAENGTDKSNVVAKLKNVNIDDFAPLFIKAPRLEGLLTGTVTLEDPFGKPTIVCDAVAQKFTLDNKEIGDTKLKGNVSTATGLIKINAQTNNNQYDFDITGNINYKDSTDKQMDISFLSKHFDMSLLNNYLGSIFSNIKGDAVSDLKIIGGANHQSFIGNVLVTDGSLKVNYTQCKYNFTNQTLQFKQGELNLGTIALTDTLRNKGTASGKIYFDNVFENLSFDNVTFETPKMLLLNTNEKDNNQFYGKVIGNAVMTLDGDITDMKMKIDGEPSVTDTSHIYLPTGSGKEVGTIDYIDFIQFGKLMEDAKNKQGSNFFLDMDLKANPACKIDVILDAVTGDVIKGTGNGVLNITVGTKEPLSIRGKYDITEGDYKFNFQTVLKKYFSINKGSITWNGDPFLATINIDAAYLATKVDLSSIASSTGKLNQRSDINIVAHLTNTLKEPKIAFDFVIPKDNQTESTNDPVVQENLKKFSKDENEQNRQVASLLLFNTFITDNNGGFAASFITGTVGQVISGFLNNQLTKFFQKVFNDPTLSLYFTVNSSVNSSSNYNLTSAELINAIEASGNTGLKKEYYNGRLIVSFGVNVDYNNPYILQARNTNVLLTPDLTVEYILTADKKFRIVGFNRTSVDATLGQRNRTGLRLSYQKEFDKKRKKLPVKKLNPETVKLID